MPLTFRPIWRLGIQIFTLKSNKVRVYCQEFYYLLLITISTHCAGLYKLNIDFSGPLPTAVTCVAFMEFDGVVSVNHKSQIQKSYTQ